MCGGSKGSSTVVAADPAVSNVAPNVQQQTESAAKAMAKKQRNKGGRDSNVISSDRGQLGGSTILDAAFKKELG